MITRIINWLIITVTAVLCLLVLFAPDARAQTVGVHTWSDHSHDTYNITHEGGDNTSKKFNEANFGLYFLKDGWVVGAYRNSYYRTTVYGGYVWQTPLYGPLDVAVSAALATGYRRVHGVGVLRPMLMPQLVLHLPAGLDLRYSVAPAKGGAFQHLSIETSFNQN